MSNYRRFNAYYYAFTPTGIDEVDKVLSAICIAGKGYHHTEYWNEEKEDYSDYSGGSYIGWIQNSANEAAEKIKQLESELLSYREFKKEALEVIKESYPCHDELCAIQPGDDLDICICWVKKRSAFLAKHSEEKGDYK